MTTNAAVIASASITCTVNMLPLTLTLAPQLLNTRIYPASPHHSHSSYISQTLALVLQILILRLPITHTHPTSPHHSHSSYMILSIAHTHLTCPHHSPYISITLALILNQATSGGLFLLGHMGMDLINGSNISNPLTLASVPFPEGDGTHPCSTLFHSLFSPRFSSLVYEPLSVRNPSAFQWAKIPCLFPLY